MCLEIFHLGLIINISFSICNDAKKKKEKIKISGISLQIINISFSACNVAKQKEKIKIS